MVITAMKLKDAYWGWDTTERIHFHFSLSCIGERNGNPLQCSCLENPRDGGAWWAAVSGVAQSRTRLKWLSSSMNESYIKCPLFPVPEMYINCSGPERRSSVLTLLPLSRVNYSWNCPVRKMWGKLRLSIFQLCLPFPEREHFRRVWCPDKVSAEALEKLEPSPSPPWEDSVNYWMVENQSSLWNELTQLFIRLAIFQVPEKRCDAST